jgi:hypothetical protein
MPAQLSLPLGISVFEQATLLIPLPTERASASPKAKTPVSSPAQRVTRRDLSDLPASLPHDPNGPLISSHALDVRYRSLWHGMLASPGRSEIPEHEGFHPGMTPALPPPVLIHPDVAYLRRDALYFPYLRRGARNYLLSLPYHEVMHTPFLIGLGGLIVPFVYVSRRGPVDATSVGGS